MRFSRSKILKDKNPTIYHMFPSRSGAVYFVGADVLNSGDHVYVRSNNKEGFGGSVVKFETTDGEHHLVVGPWRSCAGALLHSTGVNIMDKVLTKGVIGRVREWRPEGYIDTYSNPLELDPAPVLGVYDRIVDRAMDLADEHNEPMHYTMASTGGTSSGWAWPSSWDNKKKQEWADELKRLV